MTDKLIRMSDLEKYPIREHRCDKKHANEHFINGIESVFEFAENLPAVDAVEVVRCADCAVARNPESGCYGRDYLDPEWYCPNGTKDENRPHFTSSRAKEITGKA